MKRRSSATGRLPRALRISASIAGRRVDLPLCARVAVGVVGSSFAATLVTAFFALAASRLATGFAPCVARVDEGLREDGRLAIGLVDVGDRAPIPVHA